MSIFIFFIFVGIVLAISAITSRRARGVGGYFVANSSINWGVNGIAFAGSYLSVASFLGICGLIAFFGFDGFLYSIGFLAGWVIALFVIAEPMKRMGTFTFSDALDQRFKHRGIRIAAGLSVLVVSLFYLVPQMVGAGVLIEPLVGLPHVWGVIIVGAVIILIVALGGMTSTTYVQFFNGGLLLLFAGILSAAVLIRGVSTIEQNIEEGFTTLPSYQFQVVPVEISDDNLVTGLMDARVLDRFSTTDRYTGKENLILYEISHLIPAMNFMDSQFIVNIRGQNITYTTASDQANLENIEQINGEPYLRIQNWWRLNQADDGTFYLTETQSRIITTDGMTFVNGAPENPTNRLQEVGGILNIPDTYQDSTGAIGPLHMLGILSDPETTILQPKSVAFTDNAGNRVWVYYDEPTAGSTFMRPGLMFPLEAQTGEPATTTLLNRLNFISLMLALFLGTAALPHILIRYYTVPDPDAARKSTIIAIIGIGLFYVFTMFMGVGAINSGALNPETSNMSAPLLARSFGQVLFAMISGIAFTTVLATVSGLIMAASGAVAHDLMDNFSQRKFSDKAKVQAGRIVAIIVGIIGVILGIFFREMNVSFLVGWAFAVAASANLPSLIMMLFWKKISAKGIIASIFVGIISSVTLIMLSPDMWARYGMDPATAPMPINQPGIISIPLSFAVLVIVSLATAENRADSTIKKKSKQPVKF